VRFVCPERNTYNSAVCSRLYALGHRIVDIMEDAGAEIFERHPYLHNLSVVFVPQVRAKGRYIPGL
jgi:hypothetical protein